MRPDELPVYPTPQQATYTASAHSSSPQQRRTQKPSHNLGSTPPSQNIYASQSSSAYNYGNVPPQNHYSSPHQASSASLHHHSPPNQYYQPPAAAPPQQHQPPQQQQQQQQQQHHHQSRMPSSNSQYSNNYQGSSHGQQYQYPPQSTNQPQYYQNSPQYQSTSPNPQYGSTSTVNNVPHQQQAQPSHQVPQQGARFDSSSHSPQVSTHPSGSSSHPRHHPAKKPPSGNSMSKESLAEQTKLANKQRLEADLRATFDKVDTDRSGRISPAELSAALVNFDNTGFQNSTVRLMIKLFTNKNSSAAAGLDFEQFVSLWKYLTAYKKLFVAADVNKSGDISFGEFQRIIEQIGYKLNVDLVLFLFSKFSNKEALDNGSIAVGKLKFDSFIELLVYLRKLTDIFKQYDKELTGVATIDYSDFLFEISNLT